MGKLPSSVLRRPGALVPHSSPHSYTSSSSSSRTPLLHHRTTPAPQHQQVRHATFVPRHRRPYTFTQIVQQSDGSTYTVRTTSPQPLLRSQKDTRNHIMWQPSEKSLRNVEVDEAGKLAAFRERFGRGWDLEASTDAAAEAATPAGKDGKDEASAKEEAPYDPLGDLLSSYAAAAGGNSGDGLSAKDQARAERKKKK